ncbi:hypothetical protein GCM10027347_16680 [Larkinella harenae]
MTTSKPLSLQAERPIKVTTLAMTLAFFFVTFAAIGLLGTGYRLWSAGQPSATLWVVFTLELTFLVAGASLYLLALGEKSGHAEQ